MPIPKKFWLVKGDGPARHVHVSAYSAEQEAKRLAREMSGQPFYVCEAVLMVIKHDVEVVSLRERAVHGKEDDEGIPF